jgi:hypothetical protein
VLISSVHVMAIGPGVVIALYSGWSLIVSSPGCKPGGGEGKIYFMRLAPAQPSFSRGNIPVSNVSQLPLAAESAKANMAQPFLIAFLTTLFFTSTASATTYSATITWYGTNDERGSPNCNSNTVACGFYTYVRYYTQCSLLLTSFLDLAFGMLTTSNLSPVILLLSRRTSMALVQAKAPAQPVEPAYTLSA